MVSLLLTVQCNLPEILETVLEYFFVRVCKEWRRVVKTVQVKDELWSEDRFSKLKIPYLKPERLRESAHFDCPKGEHWSSTSYTQKCPAQCPGPSGVQIWIVPVSPWGKRLVDSASAVNTHFDGPHCSSEIIFYVLPLLLPEGTRNPLTWAVPESPKDTCPTSTCAGGSTGALCQRWTTPNKFTLSRAGWWGELFIPSASCQHSPAGGNPALPQMQSEFEMFTADFLSAPCHGQCMALAKTTQ